MTTLFANNADTQLAAAINDIQTTISVLDASEFPAGVSPTDPIWVTIADADNTLVEITLCTGISGNNLTVVRGQDGTSAQSHPLGAYVEARLVRAVFTEIQSDIEARAPTVHTHVEADITDLDKYTQAEVDAALVLVGVPAGGTVGQYQRKQSATDYDILWEDLKIADDSTPILGGELQTDGNAISLQDATSAEQGRIGYDVTIDGVYLGFVADPARGFDPLVDGGVLAKAGELTLSGSVVELNAFKGGNENLQVYVSEDGVLFGVRPPIRGWEEVDTDNADYTFPTISAWVHIVGLFITVPQDVDVGDRIDAFVNLYVVNGSSTRGGSIDIGIGIDGVSPATALNNVRIEGGFDAVIPTSITTTSHGGLTAGQTLSVFVRRATEDHSQFNPQLFGSIDPSELIVSVPGATGGGGSDPTNLGNTPGASTVTITSSTGTNTVIAGAVSGTAGVMTGAQVDSLANKIDTTGVTYENLDANNDVGPGVGQLEPGLDVPTQDGYVLSSTVAGVRSWVSQSGGISDPVDAAYGYTREGPPNNQWVRGARVFEGPTEPVDWAVGDFWVET